MSRAETEACRETGWNITHVDSLLRVGLLDYTDSRIGDKNEQNHERFDERAPPTRPFRVFEEREDERDDSRGKEDENELVLELFEDEFPQWSRWIFRELCRQRTA